MLITPPGAALSSPLNKSRIEYDLSRLKCEQFDEYFPRRKAATLETELFNHPQVWLEIGAGTGWFFTSLAKIHPEIRLIAIERSRMRGRRLVHRSRRTGLGNIFGFRGNAIASMIHEVPEASLDRIYILYPPPWPRISQRRNRWFLHPIMRHVYRSLKPGGLLLWASDQRLYIEEASYVCCKYYGFKELVAGELSANPYNHLERYPTGRTKFEAAFMEVGQPCFELIVTKG